MTSKFQVMTIVDIGYIQSFGSFCNAIGALAVGQVNHLFYKCQNKNFPNLQEVVNMITKFFNAKKKKETLAAKKILLIYCHRPFSDRTHSNLAILTF